MKLYCVTNIFDLHTFENEITTLLEISETSTEIYFVSLFFPWNYSTNRSNMYENSFIKVYWIRHGFEVVRDSLLTKNRNISCHQTTNLLKTWFLFLVCKKRHKEDKTEFASRSVGTKVTIIFMQKYLSNCK